MGVSRDVIWLVLVVAALVVIVLVLLAPRRRRRRRRGPSVRPAAPHPRPRPRARAVPMDLALAAVDDEDEEGSARDVTQVGKVFPGQDDPSTRTFALILISAAGRTDIGRRRELNEDSYLVSDAQQLYVVADGMGGHAAGEVASQLAVDTIEEAFARSDAPLDGPRDPKLPRLGDELIRVVRMANHAVYQAAQADESRAGMGTTLVAARFAPNKARVYIAHVGDSRCYRLRAGALTQLTRDHTFHTLGVGGRLGETLSRAVGAEATVEVDLTVDAPEPGDRYLLCSDGLSKMMSDEAIRAIMVDGSDITDVCQRLITTANERGGRDNVTVVLVNVERAPLPSEVATS